MNSPEFLKYLDEVYAAIYNDKGSKSRYFIWAPDVQTGARKRFRVSRSVYVYIKQLEYDNSVKRLGT